MIVVEIVILGGHVLFAELADHITCARSIFRLKAELFMSDFEKISLLGEIFFDTPQLLFEMRNGRTWLFVDNGLIFNKLGTLGEV